MTKNIARIYTMCVNKERRAIQKDNTIALKIIKDIIEVFYIEYDGIKTIQDILSERGM